MKTMETKAMMTMWAAAALVMTAHTAFADDIQLGQPGYGGTGCPAGSLNATLSPDQKTLSVLFDQFVVEAGANTGKQFDRKNCNVAIPVHIPQGFSVAVLQVDYRGYNAIPNGGRSDVTVEYFLGGQGRGLRAAKHYFGPVAQDYLITHDLEATSLVWSACGMDTNLRTNIQAAVFTNAYREQAMTTVDSQDIRAGLVYHLQWKRCDGGAPVNNGGWNSAPPTPAPAYPSNPGYGGYPSYPSYPSYPTYPSPYSRSW